MHTYIFLLLISRIRRISICTLKHCSRTATKLFRRNSPKKNFVEIHKNYISTKLTEILFWRNSPTIVFRRNWPKLFFRRNSPNNFFRRNSPKIDFRRNSPKNVFFSCCCLLSSMFRGWSDDWLLKFHFLAFLTIHFRVFPKQKQIRSCAHFLTADSFPPLTKTFFKSRACFCFHNSRHVFFFNAQSFAQNVCPIFC
jgi:hypothetical protein